MSQIRMDSILTSIKKLLGIAEDYEHFDGDIIVHINSVFNALTQLGIGPSSGFTISDKSAVWSSFLNNEIRLEAIKSYMYMKVRMMFDPPTSSAAIDSMQKMISEFEWRLNVTAESVQE